MSVVALYQARPIDDVAHSLRRLADRIEAGEYDWPITTCIVTLGHTGAETLPDADNVIHHSYHWDTMGFGPRTDVFTVRGLLSTVLHNDWGSED